MRTQHFIWALCVIGVMTMSLTTSCGNSLGVGDNPFEPIVLTQEQGAMVESGNLFAFSLQEQVEMKEAGNYIISPLSLQFILGMLVNGADPDVAEEILSVMGFETTDEAAVNEFCRRLIRELPQLDKLTSVTTARSILVSQDITLKTTYTEKVRSNYLALAESVDFSKSAEVRKKVNNWCSQNTNGMIQEMVTEEDDLRGLSAILLDATWFRGIWTVKFDKNNTEKGDFIREDGTKITAKYMKKESQYPFLVSESFSAVKLPYGNEAYSMIVVLPNNGGRVKDMLAILKQKEIKSLKFDANHNVDLWLPMFDISSTVDYKDYLVKLGMEKAFPGSYSRMFENDSPELSLVRQKSAIHIDETGTEAASVTEAQFRYSSPGTPVQPVVETFHADHPFLFMITEKSTGAILFSGAYKGI